MELTDSTTAWMMTYALVHPPRMWAGLNDVLGKDLDPAQWQALFILYYESDTLDPLRLSFETEAQTAWALQGLADEGLVTISNDHPTGCLASLAEEGIALMDDAGAALLTLCQTIEAGCKGGVFDPNS